MFSELCLIVATVSIFTRPFVRCLYISRIFHFPLKMNICILFHIAVNLSNESIQIDVFFFTFNRAGNQAITILGNGGNLVWKTNFCERFRYPSSGLTRFFLVSTQLESVCCVYAGQYTLECFGNFFSEIRESSSPFFFQLVETVLTRNRQPDSSTFRILANRVLIHLYILYSIVLIG